jgi:hypothetical protein
MNLIDELIVDLDTTFNELLIAYTLYQIGESNLNSYDDNIAISPVVGMDLQIEPIPISDLKYFKANYPHFLFEVYHGKFVQLWNNFLENVFLKLINLHLAGKRNFKELKKFNIKIDFESDEDVSTQIPKKALDAYSFTRFQDKLRIINKVFNPQNHWKEQLLTIQKNVFIRNSIQHRDNIIDEYILKNLNEIRNPNQQFVELLDENGKIIALNKGEKIILSLPEIHSFKTSILFISQKWRDLYEQL